MIIGILAAVAVPQYQTAVAKSRLMNYYQLALGIRRAQEAYYMANGTYSVQTDALDIDYSGACTKITATDTGNFACPFAQIDTITTGSVDSSSSRVRLNYYSGGYTYGEYKTPDLTLFVWFAHSDSPNEVSCTSYSPLGRTLCNSFESN